jgi:ribosomal protein L11
MGIRIKLKIGAGKATLTPPIGPILGQYGIAGKKFCDEFNEETKNIIKDTIMGVKMEQGKGKVITKRKIEIIIGEILKRCIRENRISIRRIYEIALIKSSLKNSVIENSEIKGLCKSYIATVHSMKGKVTK